MLSHFKKIQKFVFDILFPKRCVSCGKYGQFLCFNCCAQIEWVKTAICPYCGKISKNGQICASCRRRHQSNLDGVIICCHYDVGPIKNLISSLKYDRIIDVSEILGEVMSQKANEFSWTKYVITYVPIHVKRQKTRGFNQSLLISKYVSEKMGLPLLHLLARTKDTRSQVGLTASERRINIQNSIRYVGDVMKKKFD